MGLEDIVVLRLVASLQKALPKWQKLIRNSFLGDEMKIRYEELVISRLRELH